MKPKTTFGADQRAVRFGRGFTLIELLVVIAIIGILAALVMCVLIRIFGLVQPDIFFCQTTITRMDINNATT